MKKEDSIIKLSIVIPYHKTLELTKKLLDNIKNQLTSEVEVILVDDDVNTFELDKYKSSNITIIHHEENSGNAGKPRNTGKKLAIGKYTWFIDSDDDIKPYAVSKWIDKINTEEFDYCLCSWEATGRLQGKYIIKDNPPSWNTSIWNCIYKTKNIKDIYFDKKRNINEDTEFNKKARIGKKANIEDILYIYNSGREDSLTSNFNKGIIKANKNEEIKTQYVIYRSYLSLLGGIETAVYNACMQLKDIYDVVFIYDTCDLKQLKRLSKIVKCVKYENQKIKCDVFTYYGVNPQKIENTLDAKIVHQHICNDMASVAVGYVPSPKTTLITADSQASAIAFTNKYHRECKVLHNLFITEEQKKVLHLMSATRLSPEKGAKRMLEFAKRLNQKGILFEWIVFTNDLPLEEVPGFIYTKPRLDVTQFMWGKDFGIQLSDTESWGCTVTEFLDRNVPVICTEWASVREQVEDDINGYILKKDLSNMNEIIDKMYKENIKGFKRTKPYSINEWSNIIGNLGGKKDNYIPEEIKGYEVIVEKPCFYSLENKQCSKGDLLIIETEERLNDLINRGYVKLM